MLFQQKKMYKVYDFFMNENIITKFNKIVDETFYF